MIKENQRGSKMDWGEFFKVTREKIIIFLVLWGVILVSYIGSKPARFCFMAPCQQPLYTEIFMYIFGILGFFLRMARISPAIGVLGIIIEIMVLYLVSCVVATLIDLSKRNF
jgi:hypothetical protein